MNVDEAMVRANNYRDSKNRWKKLKYEITTSELVAISLAAEVERLRAELAQLRQDWCDDDEAIKQQALRVLDSAKVEGDSWSVPRMGSLAEMMADEIERLRAILPPTAHTGVRNGPGDGGWSVFAEKVVAERDAAVAEVERLRKEVAKLQAQLDVAAAAAMVELQHMLDNAVKAQQKG